MPGNKSRDKGAREERHIASLLGATKVSRMRKPGHDLEMPNGDTVEVKIQAQGFKSLYKWLSPVNLLVVRADRQPALVVMRLDDYLKLIPSSE